MVDLFTIDDLITATGGYGENINADSISSISIDSRSIVEDALYVAIKGDRFDGHGFVHKAVVNGAAVALVSKKKARELAGLPLIIVDDPLAGLVKIAAAARTRSKAKIVAITGSAGKTTTKCMVAEILSLVGETHASIKSYNNHWGVPLMLASMPESAEFGVFEIGMNHAGEITPLVEMVCPDVVLVTSIGPAHVGNFDGMEGIAAAKSEIFSGLKASGTAIINADHDYMSVFEEVSGRRRSGQMDTYGFGENASHRIFDYVDHEDGCTAKVIRFVGNKEYVLDIKLGVHGRHMMANAVGAMDVAAYLDVDRGIIQSSLKNFRASAGRGQVLVFGLDENPLIVLDESYNANPASVAAVLQVYSGMSASSGDKVLVLGDMLELGERSGQLHMELVPTIIQSGAQKVFLVGQQMGHIKGPLSEHMDVEWVANVDEIADSVAISLDYGDTIMVKGSLGIALSGVIEAIRKRFDKPETA